MTREEEKKHLEDLKKIEEEAIEDIKKLLKDSFDDIAEIKGWKKIEEKEEN